MEGKRKHLTLADRIQIERGLDSNKNFTEIGKEIGKDPTTVSKEVRKHIHAKVRYMPSPMVGDLYGKRRQVSFMQPQACVREYVLCAVMQDV